MGAEFNYRVFADKSGKSKIEKTWNSLVEESLYESGHSYSGCIGMLGRGIRWLDKQLTNQEEAVDYLCENHEKWQSADAVSYFEDEKKYWVVGGWCSS